MSQLKKNIFANFAGKGWSALMMAAFVPIHIKFMGMEAYGLVGFFASLQIMLTLLDMGLSTTLNKEIARLSALNDKEQEVRDLVRTLELIYWGVAIIITLTVTLFSPFISSWVNPQHLSSESVRQAVLMMGLATALHFPFSLYSGGLIGLQRQVLFNGLTIVVATCRGVGAALILWGVSPTIQAYLGWQILVSLAQTFFGAFFLWKNLPMANAPPRFKKSLLFGIWRFAAGMSGISVLAVVLTQLDKVILIKVLTLEMFGYYSLASTLSSGLYLLVSPIYIAIFPRFSQLVSQGERQGLRNLYHQSCQISSMVLLPVAIIVTLFSREILLLWTGSNITAEKTHLLVSLLIVGTAMNALVTTPYALQLAHGWTTLVFYQNLLSVIFLGPFIFWMASSYAAAGAATVWVILNSGYLLIGLQIMHRYLLKGELWRWYLVDVGCPFLGAFAVSVLGRWFFPRSSSLLLTFVWLSAISILAMAASILATPCFRNWIMDSFKDKNEILVAEVIHESFKRFDA